MVEVALVMNLHMAQTVAGKSLDYVLVGTVGPADRNGAEHETDHHGQKCNQAAPLAPEYIPQSDL